MLRGELSAFPIIVGQQQRIYEALAFNSFKEIKKSIQENGATSPFSKGLITSLTDHYAMSPWDWQTLCKTAHEIPQYLIWLSEFDDLCEQQATQNQMSGIPITALMLGLRTIFCNGPAAQF